MQRHTRWALTTICVCGLLAAWAWLVLPSCQAAPKRADVESADKLFEAKNYKEAGDAYEAFLATRPKLPQAWRASKQLALCRLRMQDFDRAIAALEDAIKRFAGNAYEARAERNLGNLYLHIPHHGTIMGGKFKRGIWDQGTHVTSYRLDRQRAVQHLERARGLCAKFETDDNALAVLDNDERAAYRKERIECIFDLAAAVTRFGPYDHNWRYWWRPEELTGDDTVGEYEAQQRGYRRQQGEPKGIAVNIDGKPVFDPVPIAYDTKLPLGQKMKYLLHEAERLDNSPNRDQAALAVYRRAMLARARYGPDRLNQWRHFPSGRGLDAQIKKHKLWELADNEVLTLLGGRIAVVQLPTDEDIIALLRAVVADYPKAEIAPEAQYALGLYYQSRQQYPQAVAEYDKLPKLFPQAKRIAAAQSQKARILTEEVIIGQTGVQLPGTQAVLDVTHRNASEAQFTARKVDLEGCMKAMWQQIEKNDPNVNAWELRNLPRQFISDSSKRYQSFYKQFVGDVVAQWSAKLSPDPSHRYKTEELTAPLYERGCYLIEAKSAKSATCRAVLLLQDLAIVSKNRPNGRLLYICDALTGDPISGAKVTLYEYCREYMKRTIARRRSWKWLSRTRGFVANDMGLVEYAPQPLGKRNPDNIIVARTADGRVAFIGVGYWGRFRRARSRSGPMAYCLTDRPVYRPEQTVHFKVWARELENGEYNKRPARSVWVRIRDPKGKDVYSQTLEADEFQGVSGSFKLGAEPPLGMYRIRIKVDGRWANCVGNRFRVEEYKKPEFEVTVEPAAKRVKLGRVIEAVIRAKYYFGAPVTNARVKYKVMRESYEHRYVRPGRWDWLYGAGYGSWWYDYEWFGWWRNWGPRCVVWYPWWGPAPQVERELVQEGEAPIREDGTVQVSIDTAPALRDHPDTDHLYTIEAEVCDASRRTITGSGAVKATRNEFYAFVDTDRGYYTPGQQIFAHVQTLTPDNRPVKTKGKVSIARVLYTGENNAKLTEEPFKSWEAATDDNGRLDIPLITERSGQFKIAFETTDSWGNKVVGATVIWIAGADFDGRLYRFTDLELITDKRTYKPGEVVHLMLNTNRAGQWVLFSDDVDNRALWSYRLIRVDRKSRIIDIPVKEGHVPNFFVEATCVSNCQVHQQAREIFVPPTKGMVDLAVSFDKSEYRPGQTGRVTVKATTPDGKPARTQVVVAAFDKSILYIQPEFAPDIRKFFWGQKRRHRPQMNSNLQNRFSVSHSRLDPSTRLYQHGLPKSWNGSWGLREQDWRVESDGIAFGGLGRMRAKKAGTPMLAMAAPPAAGAAEMETSLGVAKEKAGAGRGEVQLVKATVRKEFADTALWRAALVTDPKTGAAATDITFPDNLTTWKLNAHGMTTDTRVGATSTTTVTTKHLIVRLQAPRFFVERDEVVLSANVHNYLASAKLVQVSIDLPGGLLELLSDKTAKVKIDAKREARVDWVVKVKAQGTAVIKMEALTDEESDAVKMEFPVFVHGIDKTVSQCASIRADDANGACTMTLDVPADRDPSASRLEVRFSPSLAGAMLDALPYLIAYPYGCVEQTMSRFMPAVLTKKTLTRMGIRLEDVRRMKTNLDSQTLGPKDSKRRWRSYYCESPVFDSDELDYIVDAGLKRIYAFQQPDGGWGWWASDRSSPYQTAYVLQGLITAADCDVAVNQNCVTRGIAFLKSAVAADVKKWKEDNRGAWASQAYLAYVLSLRKAKNDDLLTILFERRDWLGLYGKSLLCLTLHNLGDERKAKLLLRNIMQYAQTDDENQTTWFKTPQSGWWFWWNNDIEANAYVLRAICAIEPKSPTAPRLVKWLLNNRRNGYYWRSTRDTAICIMAMADYMQASGESTPDYTLLVDFDRGAVTKQIKITPKNFFTFDNSFTLAGDALTTGRHTLKLTRQGAGALYASCYLSYFTKEENITAAGLEIKVARRYYRLERVPRIAKTTGSRGQKLAEQRVRYKRIPLNTGDEVTSGDLLEIELLLTSKNDYDYLVFEDMKAAGCEPVEVRSGAKYGELCSNMELRDEKVVFFVGWLSQGEHLIKYRVRAETPGKFHALPTKGWAMYAPEIRANSDEMRLRIRDGGVMRDP